MKKEQLIEIADKYGTSAYIFDIRMVEDRVSLIKNKLGDDIGLCYAMKANPFLTDEMDDIIDRIEVCSPGEYEICMAQNIEPDKLIVSGVNKSEESIRRILEYSGGRGIYTIESYKHFEILKRLAGRMKLKLSVLIRLSSGNQFGVDRDTLFSLIDKVKETPELALFGIHFFSGTQKKMAKIEKELSQLSELGIEISKRYGEEALELEYGPGLGVSYFVNDTEKEKQASEPETQLDMLVGLIDRFQLKKIYGKITIELGRFIAADCGTYITEVEDVKRMAHGNYAIVDGGIHQLSYFGQMLGMKLPYMYCIHISDTSSDEWYVEQIAYEDKTDNSAYTICGSLCSVNDVMAREIPLEALSDGDLLIFEKCGAYSMTEGISLFLSRDLPHIFLLDKNGRLIQKRKKTETYFLNGGEKNG